MFKRESRFIKERTALYENNVAGVTFGPHQIVALKEHLVRSREFSNITYYTHYYNECMGMRVKPSPPSIDSSGNLPALCSNTEELEEPHNVSDADAYMVELPDSNHQPAKDFLRRSLKTVSASDHQKILDIWKSLVICDAEFGTGEEMVSTFEEALQHTNKRELTLQVLDWLIRNEKSDKIEIIQETMLRKFKTEKDIYVVLIQYYMKRGERKKAKNLLAKSCQCVPAKTYQDIMEQFINLHTSCRA